MNTAVQEKPVTSASAETPVVVAKDLRQVYKIGRGFMKEPDHLQAVGGVSFSVDAGKTLAVVGESGCGKSTLARMVSLIETPTAGELRLTNVNVLTATPEERKTLRQAVQMVFQNPFGSLNPRKKIGAVLEAPLEINTSMTAAERADKARAMLALVGLRPEHYDRYPHMFSGGQRQRVAIARALMLKPSLIVADEPVSALDVSIQAQVLNLLADLQHEMGLAYLFISHDLGVVRHIAHDVLGHVLGSRGGTRREEGDLCPTASPLHPGLAGLYPRHRRHRRFPKAHCADWRIAFATKPAKRLRFLNALPQRDRKMPGRTPRAARTGRADRSPAMRLNNLSNPLPSSNNPEESTR